jgi:periplasmic protein TonB
VKLGVIFGVFGAVLLHLGFILFGGLIFGSDKKEGGSLQQVELLSEEEAAEKEKEKEPEPETPTEASEELETEEEQPPDAEEIIRSLEVSPLAAVPELGAVSLSAIEDALRGTGGGGDEFGGSVSLASGGRIGGTGKAGVLDETMEKVFSLGEIDQDPRAIYKATPQYPGEMRGKKVEGVVTVICVIDSSGKVTNPRVEKSSHPAFDQPALDAVKQWKFEPALKAGQRVHFKMRIPIRFKPS